MTGWLDVLTRIAVAALVLAGTASVGLAVWVMFQRVLTCH